MRPATLLRTLLALALLIAAPACAADRLFVNGSFITLEASLPRASALLVREGHIAAIGESATLRAAAPAQTQVIDLQGRTVIPGLVDSHIHAIRAGLSYATEVHWTGAATIPEALQRLRNAATALPPGGWLIVAGGWTELQFAERRRPTEEEVEAAAPEHRIYIQHLYSGALLSKSAVEALDLANKGALLAQLKTERESGELTGWFSGETEAITALFDLLPRPSRTSRALARGRLVSSVMKDPFTKSRSAAQAGAAISSASASRGLKSVAGNNWSPPWQPPPRRGAAAPASA